ncbi:hypothetical protein N9P30_03090 [Alphaproteobacteria bacterium]|nr:hypothetical protein [Alphaproteobacteria bacterium]
MSGEEIDKKSVGNSAVYLLVDFEKTLYNKTSVERVKALYYKTSVERVKALYYKTSVERVKALYYKTSVERDKAQPDFVAAWLSPPYIQEDLR